MSCQYLPSIPTKRLYTSVTKNANFLYVLGGCDVRGQSVNSVESFNLSTLKWTGLPYLSESRAYPSCVSIGKKIITMGGRGTSKTCLDTVEIFDLESKNWSLGPKLREPINRMNCIVKDDQVFSIGGTALNTNPVDFFMKLDISNLSWSLLKPLPSARYSVFCFFNSDKLYTIGGRQGKLASNAFEVFDFGSNFWKKLPVIPSKRVFSSYVVAGDLLFSLGGLDMNSKKMKNTTEIFNLKTESWSVVEGMNEARSDFTSMFFDNKVYVFGGLGQKGLTIDSIECFDIFQNKWLPLDFKLPIALSSSTSFTFDGQHFIIGGISNNGISDKFIKYQ